jgi:hypothetical protein
VDKQFVVATRYFESDTTKGVASLARLREFAQNALAAGAARVYVAVNAAVDVSQALEQVWPENVTVFPVTPWGGFVMPLNALLLAAREELARGAKFVTASVEVKITAKAVGALLDQLDDQTLVVGAALLGHQFKKGSHQNALGREVPWNTLAVWNSFLWVTGFPLMGDGPLGEPQNKGVEELFTIAAFQRMYPSALAKLVPVAGQTWDTSTFDGERLAKHEAKMASKNSRPAAQLVAAQLPGPTVVHV